MLYHTSYLVGLGRLYMKTFNAEWGWQSCFNLLLHHTDLARAQVPAKVCMCVLVCVCVCTYILMIMHTVYWCIYNSSVACASTISIHSKECKANTMQHNYYIIQTLFVFIHPQCILQFYNVNGKHYHGSAI